MLGGGSSVLDGVIRVLCASRRSRELAREPEQRAKSALGSMGRKRFFESPAGPSPLGVSTSLFGEQVGTDTGSSILECARFLGVRGS